MSIDNKVIMAILSYAGMNNRAADTKLPEPSQNNPFGKYRNAVNVDFDNEGHLLFPRIGSTLAYSGTECHSWYEYEDSLGYGLFVDGTSLKRLNLDDTATTLKTVNPLPMSYCVLNGNIYFSNGSDTGIYVNGTIKEWGVEVPPMQPLATATATGGMYAGEYRVVITWLTEISNGHYEESGTGNSTRVTVADGGGIRLSDFPLVPSTIDSVAVYVSSVNSQDLYLYDEYPANISEVFIRYNVGTVKLDTQFGFKVRPKLGLTVHYGRVYWIDGNFIYYTEAQHYGLQRAGSYFHYESPITNIISVPGALFITTETGIYRISGIDSEQPTNTQVKTYGAPEGSYFQDFDDTFAYLISHNGFCKISSEGIVEIAQNDIAFPVFMKGSAAVVEHQGYQKLIAVMQEGTVSTLQHPEYTANEVARGNASGL